MRKLLATLAAAATVLTACDGFGQAVRSHTDVVARAAGHELTVDQAAALIAPYNQVPAQRDVVEALANLWVDYTLLSTAASQDSMLGTVDMGPLLRMDHEQALVFKLRDKVINPDTAISEEDLRKQYEAAKPGLQVRARHILLRLTPDATPAVRDSVTQLAGQLETRAKGGEDFAMLARAFSQDGSAQQGGDLGFFGKGGMVAPFEEAAFALGVGGISGVVETPFGLHIIKVEERQQPPFEEVRDSFRTTVVEQRGVDAERTYIEGLTNPLNIAVEEGAVENARELARDPSVSLRGRAASRALARYQGGTLTAAEYLDAIRMWNPGIWGQLIAAQDAQVKQVLEGMTRNKILVAEAEKQGLAATPEEADSLQTMRRFQLRITAVNAGLTAIQPQDGETMREAVERRVNAYLESILRGEQNAFPLGPVSYSLRKQFDGEIFTRSFDAVVQRIEARRPPTAGPQPTPVPPPDTGSGN